MRSLPFLLLIVLPGILLAQDRCGTVLYEKLRNPQLKKKETKEQFEQWMQSQLLNQKKYKNGRTQTTFVVPVVVHVIYASGDAIPGTRTNISDAQIQSQIDVLNQDYQRLNADASQTLTEFLSVAGNWDVQFVLAKQDPDGAASNGIVRVQGTQNSWSITDDRTLKAMSYWPAEDYLNLWVTDLSGIYIGYTQLPVSNTLQGLDQSSNDRLTDGVVIDYQAFGTVDAGNFNLTPAFNKGRTATHEIGHYFGLRHIWGDDFCGTDYVSDTPTQSDATHGCPTGVQVSCGNDNMYQNYLDYTDDECMNIFSKGQVDRMNVVAQNSPRRASLINSLGALPPSPVPNDLGIKSILNPSYTACPGNVAPSIKIRNYGSNAITSAQVQFFLNASGIETKSLSLTLNPDDETIVNFNSVAVAEGSSYNFDFKVLQVNGGADGKNANNDLSISASIPVSVPLPMTQSFNTTPSNWTIENPSGKYPWENISLTSTNHAMYVNFYDDPNLDAYTRLVSPVLDLTNATTATLTFDYAYAVFSSANPDQLRVIVYTSCAYDGTSVEVFNKSGSALATAPSTSSPFVPASTQWKTVFISLQPYLGTKIQIAFEGVNENGNNLYLDNVTILNNALTAIELSELVSPSPVSCLNSNAPIIAVKNVGNTVVSSFDSHVKLNDGNEVIQTISGITIDPGSTQNISLNSISLSNGNNNLSIWVTNPNGLANAASADSIAVIRNINTAESKIPLRENFEHGIIGNWQAISPQHGENWALSATNKPNDSTSLYYDAFNVPDIGYQAWFVSPTLDFSTVGTRGETGFSLFFQTSYRQRASSNDRLEVYASEDCGITFPTLVFSKSGSILANSSDQYDTPWKPTSASNWEQQHTTLDAFAGKTNVRFAFIVTNDNGNNVYLDNIEFFLSDNSNPVKAENPYSIYGGLGSPLNITFNLDQLRDVNVQVYSMQGKLMSDQNLSGVLNQTYSIDSEGSSPGLYIVRVQIANSLSATKVYIGF